MTASEHLLVLLSLILGLGLEELLSNVKRLVGIRERVRFHWLPVAWAVIVFVLAVQWWWALFSQVRVAGPENFFYFLSQLLTGIVIYLIASSVFPDVGRESSADLKAHYFDNRRWFFGLAATYEALLLLNRHVGEGLLFETKSAFNAAGLAIALVLAVSGNERLHTAVTLMGLGVLFSFIVLYSLRLTGAA